MTDKEILAELKRSYEYLDDIIENGSELHCNGQMSVELTRELIEAKDKIAKVYSEFYKTLDKNELYIKNGLYISDVISAEYMKKDEYFTVDVFEDYYEWWNDLEFLLK